MQISFDWVLALKRAGSVSEPTISQKRFTHGCTRKFTIYFIVSSYYWNYTCYDLFQSFFLNFSNTMLSRHARLKKQTLHMIWHDTDGLRNTGLRVAFAYSRTVVVGLMHNYLEISDSIRKSRLVCGFESQSGNNIPGIFLDNVHCSMVQIIYKL